MSAERLTYVRKEDRVPGRRAQQVFGLVSLALGLYMAGFTLVSFIRGNTEIAAQTGGGILMTLMAGSFLLRPQPKSPLPKL